MIGNSAKFLGHGKAGAELHEYNSGETAEKYFLDAPGHLRPSQTPEVDIESYHGHGAGKRDQTDGHSVIHG